MTRKRRAAATVGQAVPEAVRSVRATEPQSPLTKASADVWAEWSVDREQRRLETLMHAEAENRALMTQALYPRECAVRCAEDTRRYARDWRAIRPELGAAWGQLLKQQPELAPELTRQRRAVLNAIISSLPVHLQTTASELHNLIALLLTAHEAAAYHVGHEAGRLDAAYYTDANGRQRRRRGPNGTGGLRLHYADGTR